MGAALNRNAISGTAKPQVGRFYGDFLCMRSFRKNTFFAAKFGGAPDFLFGSKGWRQFSSRISDLRPLESQGSFDGK
jgi:hypothetical protein